MNKLNKWLLLALVCAFTLTLGACSEDSETTETGDGTSGTSGPDGTCQENANTCGLKGKEFDAAVFQISNNPTDIVFLGLFFDKSPKSDPLNAT